MDLFDEFFIVESRTVPTVSPDFWPCKFQLRGYSTVEEAIGRNLFPNFLRPLVEPVLRLGKTVHILKDVEAMFCLPFRGLSLACALFSLLSICFGLCFMVCGKVLCPPFSQPLADYLVTFNFSHLSLHVKPSPSCWLFLFYLPVCLLFCLKLLLTTLCLDKVSEVYLTLFLSPYS